MKEKNKIYAHTKATVKRYNSELNQNVGGVNLSMHCPTINSDDFDNVLTMNKKKFVDDCESNTFESLAITSPLKKMNMSDLGVEEDQAESVDSGCVPDLTPVTSWDQVGLALNYEYNFALGLLQHIPEHKNPSIKSPQYNKSSEVLSKDKQLQTNSCSNTQLRTSVKGPHNSSSKININIEVKKKLEEQLRKLKKNRRGNLTASQAKHQETKLRKQLTIIEKHRKKKIKKLEREKKRVVAVHSGITTSVEQATKIYNKCGKLVFSKFDFSDTVKEKWNENRKPDLNNYLSKVLKEKEKIKTLKAQGKVDEAVNYMENKAWDHAMKRAHGEKVKDDSEKLAKSLLKKKSQKRRSQAKWSDRERTVQKYKEQKQEKRKQNIAARKQKHNKSKGKKKNTKGNRVPGF